MGIRLYPSKIPIRKERVEDRRRGMLRLRIRKKPRRRKRRIKLLQVRIMRKKRRRKVILRLTREDTSF